MELAKINLALAKASGTLFDSATQPGMNAAEVYSMPLVDPVCKQTGPPSRQSLEQTWLND
jgi:hypothetical protein